MDTRRLDGTTAIVTGASRGIGAALAGRLHARGAAVVLVARSAAPLDEVAHSLEDEEPTGAGVRTIVGDVTDPAVAERACQTAVEEFGGLDLLVNNAGVSDHCDAPIWEVDGAAWWSTVATNVLGPFLFSQCAVRRMVASGAGGRIVNVGSIHAFRSGTTLTAYGVSKCALARLTEMLDASLTGTGIHAFTYSPGPVRTAIFEGRTPSTATSWVPMADAVDGLMAIAHGELDSLHGRFVHARDDLDRLRDPRPGSSPARRVSLAAAFAGDPVAAMSGWTSSP